MSRLHAMIHRLETQRACLDWAVEAVDPLEGPVLEIGLGNGRTYDHLRERVGERRQIYAFDRYLGANPASVPPADRFIAGDIRETLPAARSRGIAPAALAHADLGSKDPAKTAAMTAWLESNIAAALRPGAIVLSDQRLSTPELVAIQPPVETAGWRYYAYRRA